MSETDPHIHVEKKVAQAGADFRNTVTSMLGVAIDAPSDVTTGCGLQVPYAMTSPHPERVTCLACRDHAHREYLQLADQFDRLGKTLGATAAGITGDQVVKAVEHLRDLAKKFAS